MVVWVPLTRRLPGWGAAGVLRPLPYLNIHPGGCVHPELIKNVHLHNLGCLVTDMLRGTGGWLLGPALG